MRLKDKVSIITGGARGLGYAMATKFAEEGSKVYIADINEVHVDNQRIHYVHMDVSNHESVSEAVNNILKFENKIDVLVNNAGIVKDALINKMTDEQWDRVINVNLRGAFYVTREVLPIMYKNNKGSIINISSIVGEYGNIGQSNYAASKAGLIGLTYTWAKEFTRKGSLIRTNAIAPGFADTEMIKDVPEKILNKIIENNPMHRLAKPDEIANAALFLASDESSFVNGQVLSVNGGARL